MSRLFTAHYRSLCAAVTSTCLNSHIQYVDIISDHLILFYYTYYIKLFYCFPCLLYTFIYSLLNLTNSSAKNENAVIISSPPCWWKIRWWFVVRKTSLELHSSVAAFSSKTDVAGGFVLLKTTLQKIRWLCRAFRGTEIPIWFENMLLRRFLRKNLHCSC